MRLVSADPTTQVVSRPPNGVGDEGSDDGSATRVLVRPVFTREGDGRRRLLARGGYLAAASGLAYLAMVLVSVTAAPASRPAAAAAPASVAPTTVRQVTPERPQAPSSAPVAVAVPGTATRSRAPIAPPRTTTAAPPAASGVVPTTSVAGPPTTTKPSRPGSTKTTTPAGTKTTKPAKTVARVA